MHVLFFNVHLLYNLKVYPFIAKSMSGCDRPCLYFPLQYYNPAFSLQYSVFLSSQKKYARTTRSIHPPKEICRPCVQQRRLSKLTERGPNRPGKGKLPRLLLPAMTSVNTITPDYVPFIDHQTPHLAKTAQAANHAEFSKRSSPTTGTGAWFPGRRRQIPSQALRAEG
jgi:hypothetical protein